MDWRDFFFLSWMVEDDENEQLRQENARLRAELDERENDDQEDDPYQCDEDQ